MRFRHIVGGAALALIVTACDLSSNKTPPEGFQHTATFQVVSLTGASDTSQVDKEFQVPTEKLFNFEACLVDNLFQKKLSNQSFRILNGDQEIARATSNEAGCVTWTEKIKFNFFDKSHYVYAERGLEGDGASQGRALMKFAIDPWLHGEKIADVVDLTKKQVPVLAQGAFVTDASAPLWAERLELQDISEWNLSQGQLTFKAKLSLPAQFLTKDTQDRWVTVPIPSGHFKLDFTLYQETREGGATQDRLLASVKEAKVSADKGVFNTDIYFQPKEIPATGTYKIALRLKALDSGGRLRNFEGTFNLGPASTTALAGTKVAQADSAVLDAHGAFSIQSVERSAGATPSPTGYYVAEGLRCTFDRYRKETTTTRSLSYRVAACLQRRDGQALRANVPIQVTKNRFDDYGARETTERLTDERGCIDWQDSLEHKYFAVEKRMLATFTLQNAQLGLSEQVPLQINPWDYGWTFCRDARTLEDSEKQELYDKPGSTTLNGKPSEYFMDYLNFTDQRVDYQVDENLNRKVIKTVRFSLHPQVRRPSSQTVGENQVEPLRTGLYLLRFAVLRNAYEDPKKAFSYVAGGEAISQVVAGRLIKDVAIRLKDPRLMNSRNRILIELSTVKDDLVVKAGPSDFMPKPGLSFDDVVDSDSGLAPKIFEGAMELGSASTISLYPFDVKHTEGLAFAEFTRFSGILEPMGVASALPQNFQKLGDLITFGQAIEKRELQAENVLKDHFFDLQDLKSAATTPPALSQEGPWREAIETSHASNAFLAELCHHWARRLVPAVFQEQLKVDLRGMSYEIEPWCLRDQTSWMDGVPWLRNLAALSSRHFLFQIVDQVEAASMDEMVPPGRNFQLTVASSFSIEDKFGSSQSFGYGVNAGWDAPTKLIPGLQQLGFGFGLSASADKRFTWNEERGNSYRFDSGMRLDVEENLLRLKLEAYHKCLIVRLSPQALDLPPYRFLLAQAPSEKDRILLRQTLQQRGLYFCSKDVAPPKLVEEKYFYFSSPKALGYVQDPTDIRNRFYAMEVRSARDFSALLHLARTNLEAPGTSSVEVDGTAAWMRLLDKTYSGIVPGAPGIFIENVF